jgi:putative ABC transport system permease protein
MRIFDLLSLIFYNLSRRKGRVMLTAVGVVIGTASVVILVSLANGLQRSATSQLWGISDLKSIMVYPRYDDMYFSGPVENVKAGGPQQQKTLTEPVIAEIAAIPHVTNVIRRDYLRGMGIIRSGRLETYPMILGAGVQDVSELGFQVQAGSGKLEKGTAVIGAPIQRSFYDPKQRPGQEQPEPVDLLDQQVRLVITKYTNDGLEIKKTHIIRITGILKESRNEGDYAMIVHLDEMQNWNDWVVGKRINRNREGYENIMVKVDDVDNVLEVAEQIDKLGFMASTPQSTVQGIGNFYKIVQVIFGGVGAVALLVAAIGIANTMTMAILERTREIGLMKAVGATNRDVLSIFLGESAGIGFVGGLGGVALGLLLGEAINIVTLPYLATQAAQMGAPPPEAVVFTPVWLPIFAILFATLIGLASGLYPALRAATLIPVIALKYE